MSGPDPESPYYMNELERLHEEIAELSEVSEYLASHNAILERTDPNRALWQVVLLLFFGFSCHAWGAGIDWAFLLVFGFGAYSVWLTIKDAMHFKPESIDE